MSSPEIDGWPTTDLWLGKLEPGVVAAYVAEAIDIIHRLRLTHSVRDPLTLELFERTVRCFESLGEVRGMSLPRSGTVVPGVIDQFVSGLDRYMRAEHIMAADDTGDLGPYTSEAAKLVSSTASYLGQWAADSDIKQEASRLSGQAGALAQTADFWNPVENARRLESEQAAASLAAREEVVAKQEAKRRAAIAAQNELKAAFKGLADGEEATADKFRGSVLATLGALILGAIYLLFRPPGDGIENFLPHGAISVAALVLAGYLARESAQHRKIERWARVLEVQLGTVRDYVGPLTADQQNDIMTFFGKRVLGELPLAFGGKDEDLTTALSIIETFVAGRKP